MANIRDVSRPAIVFSQCDCATGTSDGLTFMLRSGDPWDAQDPFVREHPGFFGAFPPEHTIRRTVAKV